MYQLWTHARCEKEGQIDDLLHQDAHKEVIDFMYNFYKSKYPNEFYSIRFKKISLPF
jgi:hypothetical protein